MEILKSVNQLEDKIFNLLKILPESEFFDEIKNFRLINKKVGGFELSQIAKNIETITFSKTDIENLCDMVYQLNDYLPLLSNLVEIFLRAKKYDEVFILISKIFVAHIGNIQYKTPFTCSFAERYFDRFVEVVKNCDISEKVYIPFIIEIVQTVKVESYALWKRPALEYIKNFWNENEKWINNYISEHKDQRYGALLAILKFNTNKGVEMLMHDYMHNSDCELEEVYNLAKMYKRDVLVYIDAEITGAGPDKEEKLTNLLLNFDSSSDITTRIKAIYTTTQNDATKKLISSKIGISETISLKTEKQFCRVALSKITQPQERVLGIPFDKFNLTFASGNLPSNTDFSFLIYLFKNEKNLKNLINLKDLENVFSHESLQEFLSKIFAVVGAWSDIKEAKWFIRMISLLSGKELVKQVGSFVVSLVNSNRLKEAKYFMECLAYSKRVELIEIIRKLTNNNSGFMSENFEYFVNIISDACGISISDIKDMLVTNNYTNQDVESQKKRLYEAFICGKFYTPATFQSLFINNNVFNILAQGLIFGEYRFNRLYNAFIVHNREIEFILGSSILEEDEKKNADVSIGIIHILDCDQKYESIYHYHRNPTFEQFKPARFNVKDFGNSVATVNRFSGIFISPQKFCEALEDFGFVKNKDFEETNYKSMIHIMSPIGIICEVQFEKEINDNSQYACLENVNFYKEEEVLKVGKKFILPKSNALAIGSLPYRYFDYMLSAILDASKQK